jgi:hypothetical protein
MAVSNNANRTQDRKADKSQLQPPGSRSLRRLPIPGARCRSRTPFDQPIASLARRAAANRRGACMGRPVAISNPPTPSVSLGHVVPGGRMGKESERVAKAINPMHCEKQSEPAAMAVSAENSCPRVGAVLLDHPTHGLVSCCAADC